MAATCKNCGRPVKFDPVTQKVICDFCGSKFIPEDIEEYGKDVLEKIKPEHIDDDEYMDSYVYCCSSCGGQIIINGTEASTGCIFCGAPSVVFSRIIKQKRPEVIIPFKITKEEALNNVKTEFQKGVFVPRKIKRFKADNVRGIYIPYWVFNADHYGSVAVVGSVSDGSKNSRPVYYARSGLMELHDLPVDASSVLSNESSERLEPFKMSDMVPFDESYLLGFYSDICDADYNEASEIVRKRSQDMFEDYVKRGVDSEVTPRILSSYHETEILEDGVWYAMFPAWFISYRYKGKYNTVLVNGQTGKVVCGVPYNGKLVIALYVVLSVLLTVLAFYFTNYVLNELAVMIEEDPDYRDWLYLIFCFVFAGVCPFMIGYRRLKGLFKSLTLTQKPSLFTFMNRRQGEL